MDQTSRSDAMLVEAARDARDLVAFAELVTRYQASVFAMAVSVVGDRSLAEDASQETFLRAWASLDRLRDPDRVAPWLCGIARNVARTLHRDRAREILDDEATERACERTPLRQLMEREADAALSELLSRVPNRYRAPMVLHYGADRSVAQIAACLDLSEPNVKKLLSRGRELLRERAQRFDELASACRVPAALAVTVIAGLGARTAAAQTTATAGAITTLATGVVVKKTIIITAAVIACLVLGYRLLHGPETDAARASTSGSAAAPVAAPGAPPPPALAARQRVAGVVVDDRTGAPLPGATVLITRAVGSSLATAIHEQQAPPAVAVSDAAGRFALEASPGHFFVDANLAGYTSPRPAEVEIRAGEVDGIELRLARGGIRVHGTVTDIQGGPVDGTIVTAVRAPGGIPTGQSKAAITAANGSYELWLAVGEYDVEARHPAYAPASTELQVKDDELRRDLQLVPASIIEGVVLDRREGKPVANAIVFVDGKVELGAVTDDEGRFRLAHLAAGSFALRARASHQVTLAPSIVELDIGETRTDVELVVDRAADVSGRVVDENGRPLAGVETGLLRLTEEIAYAAQAVTDAEGRFVIHGVAPGSYGAAAMAAGRPRLVRRTGIEVADRDVGDVELVVKTAHVVTGRVVPPRIATVQLARPGGPVLASMAFGEDISDFVNLLAAATRTQPDGTFEIAGVSAGTFTLVAVADDGLRGEANVVVGDAATVTIELAATPTVRGTVVDPRGKPVAGLALRASADAFYPTRIVETTSDPAGGFELRGFSPGAVALEIVDARCRRQLVADGKPGEDATTLTVTAAPAPVRLVVTGCERTLRGTVVDKQGAAVADAWVQIENDDHRSAPILTDAGGRFAAPGLHDGPFVVTAYHPTRGRGRIEAAAPDADHRIVLLGGASLKLDVREHGRPATAFEVRLRGAARRTLRARSADGTLTIDRLTAGRYKLAVRTEGGTATLELELDAGATRSVAVGLRDWSSVRGTLVGTDGLPLANHVVTPIHNPADGTAVDPGELFDWNTATTDRDGRFELRRVQPDTNVLVISSPSGLFSAAPLQLQPGEHRDLGRMVTKFVEAEAARGARP